MADRFMMATAASHAVGDLSRPEPTLAIIYGEAETCYIGEWATGYGFINVEFPKDTTRELTRAEKRHYNGKMVYVGATRWTVQFDDLPPARVYRIPQNAEDPELGPCWSWRCDPCREQSNGCAHVTLHEPGTWQAAMCGANRHVHLTHPRPNGPGHAAHIHMFGRTRCNINQPSYTQLAAAERLIGEQLGHYPARIMPAASPDALAFAMEIVTLAGWDPRPALNGAEVPAYAR